MRVLAFIFLFFCSFCSLWAQKLIVYGTSGKVVQYSDDRSRILRSGHILSLNSFISIPSHGCIILFDKENKKQYTLKRTGKARIIDFVNEDKASIMDLSEKYLSFLVNEIFGKSNSKVKIHASDPATVTRDLILQDSIKKFASFVDVTKDNESEIIADCDGEDFDSFRKKMLKDFYGFRNKTNEDFTAFRRKINKEYANFMLNPWKKVEGKRNTYIPMEEVIPPIVSPLDIFNDSIPNSQPFPKKDTPSFRIKEIISLNLGNPQPMPVYPVEEKKLPLEQNVWVEFYNKRYCVRYNINESFIISEINEKQISKCWEELSAKCDNLLIDCLRIRETYKFCDWAYLQFLQVVAKKICNEKKNESTLMTAFLYCQSGYQMRLAHNCNRLYMLYACTNVILGKGYYELNSDCYYVLEENEAPSNLYICESVYPKEKKMSLQITKEQEFGSAESVSKERKWFGKKVLDIYVNSEILKFYSTLPLFRINDNVMTQWTSYAQTPIAESTRSNLYREIKERIEDIQGEVDIANALLNFVQTSFDYERDSVVWNKERIFFAEETLFYPYSDCEDRSILFSHLIRDFLGLDVALLYSPGMKHLFTAVNFTESVDGAYIMIGGKKYIVCEPTVNCATPVGWCANDGQIDDISLSVLKKIEYKEVEPYCSMIGQIGNPLKKEESDSSRPQKSLNPHKRGDKFGYTDVEGNLVVECKYDSVSANEEFGDIIPYVAYNNGEIDFYMYKGHLITGLKAEKYIPLAIPLYPSSLSDIDNKHLLVKISGEWYYYPSDAIVTGLGECSMNEYDFDNVIWDRHLLYTKQNENPLFYNTFIIVKKHETQKYGILLYHNHLWYEVVPFKYDSIKFKDKQHIEIHDSSSNETYIEQISEFEIKQIEIKAIDE